MQKVKNRSGCGCCGAPIRVTVTGCNGLPVAGATAKATLSGVDYTATTDSAGVADIVVPSAGSYTVTSSLSPRFATSSQGPGGSHLNPIIHGTSMTSVARAMVPATGYRCINWESEGGTGDRMCSYPLPETLHLTDSVWGEDTLTWFGTNSINGGWGSAGKTISYAGCAGCPATTTNISYTIRATGPRGEILVQYWHSATRGGLNYACPYVSQFPFGPPFQEDGQAPLNSGGLTCPPAFEAEFTIQDDIGGDFAKTYLYCGVAATFTVTE